MKMNIPVRMRNPWFWISLLGVILSAIGATPEMFTSWAAVAGAVVEVAKNPFLLGCVAVAVLGVFVDPTTPGIADSDRAMRYVKPGDMGD